MAGQLTGILNNITLWVGKFIKGIFKWIGALSWFEWLIIIFILILAIIIFYLKSKVKENIRPKRIDHYRFS